MSVSRSVRVPAVLLFAATTLAGFAVAQCPPGSYTPPPPLPPPVPVLPGDVVPPAPATPGGPAAPTAPAPTRPRPTGPIGAPAPTTGAPTAPSAAPPIASPTGGPGGPSGRVPAARAGVGPRTGPRGAPIGEDLTTWQHWWEFNRDRHLPALLGEAGKTGSDEFYLGSTRRTAAAAAAPNAAMIDAALPALRRAIEQGPRDVTVAAMLSLARIAAADPRAGAFDVLSPRLGDADQGVRETAALALGLAGASDLRCRERLADVLRGSGEDRTRAFAAYGLGLLANQSDSAATKRRAFEALAGVVRDESIKSRDVRTAAVVAIGLLDVDSRDYAGARLLDDVLACLDAYQTASLGVGEQHVQAHAPISIARLLADDRARSERYRERFAELLSGREKVSHPVAQSCALALGQLCPPNETGDEQKERDARFSRVLLDVWHEHKDVQTRNFAVLALGQIGGAANRAALLREFKKASASMEQPWVALALGLCAEEQHARTGAPDILVGDTLLRQFQRAKNPEAAGALAIALGLAHHVEAGEELTRRLLGSIGVEPFAAALCEGLALLGDARAKEHLQAVLVESGSRPEVFEQAARALGVLGDAGVAEILANRLCDGEANLDVQRAATDALADVGSAPQVQRLAAVLDDAGRSAATRACAARALGGIVDRRAMRWNTPLRANANYRANVATLTDSFGGVLDMR